MASLTIYLSNTIVSLPDEFNPNNYCKPCDRHFPKRCKFRYHMLLHHNMKLSEPAPSTLSMVHPHLKPDPNDPNLHCAPCDKTFAASRNFQYHLKTIHEMKLDNVPSHQQPRQVAKKASRFVNDDDDYYYYSDMYCRKCKIPFVTAYNYRRHMDNNHSKAFGDKKSAFTAAIKAPAVITASKQVLPDKNDPDYYCKVCDLYKSSQKSYHYHLEQEHQMDVRQQRTTPPAVYNDTTTAKRTKEVVIPNKNDADFYCRACKLCYFNKERFHSHLESHHGMIMNAAPPSPPITPSPPPPQLKISSEDSTIFSTSSTATMTTAEKTSSSLLKPEINSRDLYCRVCEKDFPKEKVYRSHLKSTHGMSLAPTKESKETMASVFRRYRIPNPHDPNFYCCCCKKVYDNKAIYHQHLKMVHKLLVSLPHAATQKM